MESVRLYLWQYTDQFGKRRVTRYRLSEAEAAGRLKDPVKVAGSEFLASTSRGSTSDFLKSKPKP